MNIAEELDEERGQGKTRGMLHGIPVLVKDVRRTTTYLLEEPNTFRISQRRMECKQQQVPGLYWEALYQETLILYPSYAVQAQ